MPVREDVLVPFRAPRDKLGAVRFVRSTLVTSSQRSLRQRNLIERYAALLPDTHRDTLLHAIAGVWLTLEVAHAHYRACDRLELSQADQLLIGTEVAERIQHTFLGTILRMANGTVATPWTLFAQYQRLWDRVFDGGGGVTIIKVGPKELRCEFEGLTLVDIPYFRVAVRGIHKAGVELVATKAYVQEIPRLCTKTGFAFRVAWV